MKGKIDGSVAFLIYDFIQIMAIGDWDFVKNSQVLTIIWHVVNAALCTYITWWILTERVAWKTERKNKWQKIGSVVRLRNLERSGSRWASRKDGISH